MRYVKWFIVISFWVIIAAVFHYTLPQKDIVRVTGIDRLDVQFSTYNRPFYAQADSGGGESEHRQVRIINSTGANGRVSVYRNEDTGIFGWPPYFKIDSSNLQAEATEVISTKANPQWVIVKHYGWRSPFWTIYPNAISIKPIDGPDASKGIPFLNIFILTLFAMLVYSIWVRWRRFRMARIDPALEEIQDNWDAAGDAVNDRRGRISRWLGTWRAK